MRSRQGCLPGRTTRPSGCFPCLTTALNPTGLRQDFPRPPSPTRNQRWALGRAHTHTPPPPPTHTPTHPHTHTQAHAQRPVPRTPPLVMTSTSFPFSSNWLSRIHSIPLANPSLSSPRNSPRGESPSTVSPWANLEVVFPQRVSFHVRSRTVSFGGEVAGRPRAPKCGEGGTLGWDGAESPVGKEPPWPDVCLPWPKEVSLRPLPGPWASACVGESMGRRCLGPWLVGAPRGSGTWAERSQGEGAAASREAGRQAQGCLGGVFLEGQQEGMGGARGNLAERSAGRSSRRSAGAWARWQSPARRM